MIYFDQILIFSMKTLQVNLIATGFRVNTLQVIYTHFQNGRLDLNLEA